MQKAKERYSKKTFLSITQKTKTKWKKSQKIDTKTCQKKKKTRLKNIKEKVSATNGVQKRSITK